MSPRRSAVSPALRWTAHDSANLLRRGFSIDARDKALAELETLEADYPAWTTSITLDGCFRAVYTPTGGRKAGEAFEADTPPELRKKIARHYHQITVAHRPEGNTL